MYPISQNYIYLIIQIRVKLYGRRKVHEIQSLRSDASYAGLSR